MGSSGGPSAIRKAAALLAASLLSWLPAPAAHAGELPRAPDADPARPAQVFVQLVINGRAADGFVPLDAGGGHLLIAPADLRAAGVALQGAGAIDLSADPQLHARYAPLEQRLYLDVSVALLPQTTLHAPARERVRAEASTGVAFNYNLYVQRAGGIASASVFSEQRLFGRFGALSTTGVLRARLQGDAAGNGYLRYDTRYRYVDQDGAFAVTAGDLVTAALPWSTSVRLGGVQVGRNFAARPDLVTTPLPRFAGEAAVPSAVDVFIDGYRQGRTSVQPGRFVLDDMAVVNGAGQATLVTTDAVGRQVATTIPFYVSAALLRPGLTDFSAELGAIRRGYGQRSFGYGTAAGSFVLRHGIDPHLTLSSHGEASRHLALGGFGADWSPGLWGTAHASLAVSRQAGRTGSQLSLGYDYSGRRFTFAAEHRRSSGGFRDLGDDVGTFDLARLGRGSTTRVVAGTQLGRLGSLGLSYIDARARGGSRARVVSTSWSLPVAGRISAFATADYDVRRRAASAQVRLVVPFGRASASAGVTRTPGRGLRGDAEFDLAVPSDGGWGLSAGAALDQQGAGYGQATALLRTRSAQWEATGSVAAGQSSVGAGLSGSLLAMDGGIFAANEAPAAFAVIDTGDVAGVPVTYENQPIGKTDAKGRLFIRDVTAYHPGRIAIDPLGLDAGLVISRVESRFAVAEGAGAVLRMPIRRTQSVVARLVDALGRAIPVGSRATLPDGTVLPVGWDGTIYVTEMPGALAVEVSRAGGDTCRARLAAPASAPALANLGAVPCT